MNTSFVLLPCLDILISIFKSELEITKGEWAATEAVVKEQVVTETTLHIQGEGLQGEVLGRRDDVIKLLEKVARLFIYIQIKVEIIRYNSIFTTSIVFSHIT